MRPAPSHSGSRSVSQSTEQTASQELSLEPRMLQKIEVLGLATMDVAAYLREAYESNEALELDEVRPVEAPRRRLRRTGGEGQDLLASQPAAARTLAEAVTQELALCDADPTTIAWARFLAGSLDASGLLSLPDEELLVRARAEELPGGATELGRAVSLLQSLEPRGIGARSAVEALLLQLDPRDPDYGLLCRLLEDFLEDLARNKLPAVARALGIDLGRLGELLETVRALDLRPGEQLAGAAAPLIRPEVVVVAEEGSFAVRLERSALPLVRVDEDVRSVSRDPDVPRDVRRYLRGKLVQARWIVEAVEERQATLLRVACAVFARQRAFLEHGPGHFLPLRMSEVAAALGLHVSTVSRAVAGKDAQTPWGCLPLRIFFQAPAGAARDSALADVRAEVGHIVGAEDPSEPLSDDAIAAEMERRGWRVARRTVAKYRQELGIESSYRRRSFAG